MLYYIGKQPNERWFKDVFMRDLKEIRKSDDNRQAVKILEEQKRVLMGRN